MGTQVIPPASESKNFDSLRALWPEFHYQGYDIHTTDTALEVTYRFSIPGLTEFRPRLSFPIPKDRKPRAIDETARRILFNIGLIEMISYWKTTCAPVVRIHGGELAAAQVRFWKQLYFGGLGEFFYRNGIQTDLHEFMDIVVDQPSASSAHDLNQRSAHQLSDLEELSRGPTRMLVPVGGGKDSAVTLARLEAVKDEIYSFSINATGAAIDTMAVAGIPEDRRIIVQRSLDRNILEMNRLGYWNGHTPFSAIVAFTSMYIAYVYDLNYIVLSNESSADEATVPGTDVNHQFSKSTAFEQSFQSYTEEWLGTSVHYFSLMRPFAEIAIAREFAKHPAYFDIFRSCNVGSKENRWCGNCAKCLFIAVVLSPFIAADTLWKVIGKDLFSDLSLARDLAGLSGRVELKPWECVGTVSEVNVALTMTIDRYLDQGISSEALPQLLQEYLTWVAAGEIPAVHMTAFGRPLAVIDEATDPLSRYNEDNRVPKAFLPYIDGMLQEA